MVKRCCYGTCNTDSRYDDRVANVVFFPFPKPTKHMAKCLRWIQLCGRPHQQLNVEKLSNRGTAKHFYVCSKHFINGAPSDKHPDPVSADGTTTRRKWKRLTEFPGHIKEVFQELNNQRTQNRLCDCIIAVGNRYFSAHRCVLVACSSYFRSLLCSSDTSADQQHVVGPDGNMRLLRLDSDVVTAEAFSLLLDMMYTSELVLDKSKIADLMLVASLLQLNAVVKVCQETLNSNTLPTPHPGAQAAPSHISSQDYDGSNNSREREPTQTSVKPNQKKRKTQESKQQSGHKGRQLKSLANKQRKFKTTKCNLSPESDRSFVQSEVYEFEYEVPPETDSLSIEEVCQTGNTNGLVLKAENEEMLIVEVKQESNTSPTRWETEESTVQMDMEEKLMNKAAGNVELKTTSCFENQHTTSQPPDSGHSSRSNISSPETKGALDEPSVAQRLGPPVVKVWKISRLASDSKSVDTVVKEVSETTHGNEPEAPTTAILVKPASVRTGNALGKLQESSKLPGDLIAAGQKPHTTLQVPITAPLKPPSTEPKLQGYCSIAPKPPPAEKGYF